MNTSPVSDIDSTISKDNALNKHKYPTPYLSTRSSYIVQQLVPISQAVVSDHDDPSHVYKTYEAVKSLLHLLRSEAYYEMNIVRAIRLPVDDQPSEAETIITIAASERNNLALDAEYFSSRPYHSYRDESIIRTVHYYYEELRRCCPELLKYLYGDDGPENPKNPEQWIFACNVNKKDIEARSLNIARTLWDATKIPVFIASTYSKLSEMCERVMTLVKPLCLNEVMFTCEEIRETITKESADFQTQAVKIYNTFAALQALYKRNRDTISEHTSCYANIAFASISQHYEVKVPFACTTENKFVTKLPNNRSKVLLRLGKHNDNMTLVTNLGKVFSAFTRQARPKLIRYLQINLQCAGLPRLISKFNCFDADYESLKPKSHDSLFETIPAPNYEGPDDLDLTESENGETAVTN